MRPSVTSATLWPRSCRTPSVGVSLCSSGMPLARGPWKRIDGDEIAVELAGRKASRQRLLRMEDDRRRLDHLMLGLHRRDLDHGAAEIAGRAASGRPRPRTARRPARSTFSSPLVGGPVASRRSSPSSASFGSWSVAGEAAAPDRRHVLVQQARRRAARGSGSACRRRRGNGSRRRCRSDRRGRAAARPRERSAKSSQVRWMPAARAMATRWSVWLVEPPVACRPTTPLTIARSSIDRADRRVLVAERGDGERPRRRGAGQRVAERRVRVDEGRAGQCRPMISISIWLELAVP